MDPNNLEKLMNYFRRKFAVAVSYCSHKIYNLFLTTRQAYSSKATMTAEVQ